MMKALAITACLLFSCSVFGQENFAKQLRKIVADSSNMFRSMRTLHSFGDHGDSTWRTMFQLEGTKDNEVETDDTTAIYSAMLVDSFKRKKGENICDELKNTIAMALPAFTVSRYEVVDYKPSSYGWNFRKGNTLITVNMMGKPKDNIYYVWLTIYYFSPLPYKNE